MSEPIGPTIPGSISVSSDYTRFLSCDQLLSTVITDGQAILTGGRLSNLNDPVSMTDAATKNYVKNNLAGGTVYEPNTSIQMSNAEGKFYSSSSFVYVDNTVYVPEIIVGNTTTMTIGSGSIQGLISEPINLNDAINKTYVSKYITNTVTIATGTTLTYTSALVNTLTIRTLTTNSSDSTANAAAIVSYMTTAMSNSLATSSRFSITNMSTSYYLTVTPGSGVVIMPTTSVLTLYPGYILCGETSITDNTPSSEAVTISVLSLNYTQNTQFVVGSRATNCSAYYTKVSNQFQFNTAPNVLNTQNVIYTPYNIQGIVYRTFTGDKVDTFGSVSSFISGYTGPSNPMNYIFSTGAVEFVIVNNSVSGNLTLTSSAGWTMDPNSNMTVPFGKTGYFYLYIDTVALTGNIWTIGIFSTV